MKFFFLVSVRYNVSNWDFAHTAAVIKYFIFNVQVFRIETIKLFSRKYCCRYALCIGKVANFAINEASLNTIH